MNWSGNIVKPHILALNPEKYSHRDFRAKLDQNESPFDFTPQMKQEVFDKLQDVRWSRYPVNQVTEKLSEFLNWPESNFLLSNNSNLQLDLLFNCCSQKGQKVLLSKYTSKSIQQLCLSHQLEIIESDSKNNFTPDISLLIQNIADKQPDFIFLSSPNYPSGKALKDSELQLILDSSSGLVIIDETFGNYSFSNHSGLLSEYSRLVLLRGFNFTLSSGGLNQGAILAHEDLIKGMKIYSNPFQWNNIFSFAALEVALSHKEWQEELYNFVINERQRLYYEMLLLPNIKPYPSDSNFIFTQTTLPVEDIIEFLYKYGILVCNLEQRFSIDKGLGISVGTSDENDLFLDALYAAGEE